ncbi:sulfotransferase family 2 domain-containing protein [Alteromonas sp. 5E99-2]|uniref:sulfotransferase family 2 domain-containing protein n=1 Tax=Alteromonas sp. 5E99-2 TaxID=2817683 RepID=UPI001A99CBFC|nr:sulfotransferase family 2 domain-containing protein [Alteromonas sp. 5E99-2]MBO1254759.1 sulfotransferase family 2 domain-containing protein [Alteromonas sp. 5E99-2]
MFKKFIKSIFSERKDTFESNHCLPSKLGSMFFVHIPKTAGTSFRASFENEYKTYNDYGGSSNFTSKEIQSCIYEDKDFGAFKNLVKLDESSWIAGHVPLEKYINFIPSSNIVTFVREPIEQIISHYNHYTQHHDFSGDLGAFLDRAFAKNLQSKCLSYMPLGLIGFVGVTEYYSESLVLINKQLSLELDNSKRNVNKNKTITANSIAKDDLKKLQANNSKDIEMYKEAEFIHKQRTKLHKEDKPWSYGVASINGRNILHGCAFQHNTDSPITLEVRLNNETITTLVAKSYYGAYAKANFPRDRYVGYQFALPKDITSDDIIDVFVEGTGQKLNFKPLQIKRK